MKWQHWAAVVSFALVIGLILSDSAEAGKRKSSTSTDGNSSTSEPPPSDSGSGTSPTAGSTGDSSTTTDEYYDPYSDWYYWYGLDGNLFDPNYYYFGGY